MKTNNWLVCSAILIILFLLSCQSEVIENEDRVIIDIDSMEEVFPQTSGINVYKTCTKGKAFSKKNLEVLLRGWNEVMEELENPSIRSSLFRKNKTETLIWSETWSDYETRDEFELMWQELYKERWSSRFNEVLSCNEIGDKIIDEI